MKLGHTKVIHNLHNLSGDLVSVTETYKIAGPDSGPSLETQLRRVQITRELGRDSEEMRRKEAYLKDLLGIED